MSVKDSPLGPVTVLGAHILDVSGSTAPPPGRSRGSVIDGFSVHYELFPERLPPANQERLMLAQLEAFGFAVADLDR